MLALYAAQMPQICRWTSKLEEPFSPERWYLLLISSLAIDSYKSKINFSKICRYYRIAKKKVATTPIEKASTTSMRICLQVQRYDYQN